MLQKLLIYRTTRMAILFLIFIGVNYRSMAESKDLPKDLTNRITINVNRVSLKNALDIIAKKGKVSIIYSNSKELTSTIVSINVYDKMIKDVFYDLLNPLPFGYKVIDDKIVISFDPLKNRQLPTNQKKIPIDVKGKVTDNLGNSIPGATVRVKDRNIITATNKDGVFELHNVEEGSIIIISVVGYSPKEIGAEKDLEVIVMEVSTSKLEEVKINAGYYSITDRERTGNITKVTAATIGEQPVNNPLMALEGRVPGLQITQTTGVPGGGFKVQIRGRNNISTGNDPLYLVDGVPYPSTRISGPQNTILGYTTPEVASALSFINPNDIESIEILKDADATAIYGSRGANGVILITTKKGKAGNTSINANVSHGFSSVAHQIDLLNTQQYLDMRKEAFKNDGLQPGTTDYDVNGTWDQNKYTDWQKLLIGGKAQTTNAFVNVSGGTAYSNFLVGGNYYNEGTVFPGDFGSKKFGVHSNINIGSKEDRFNMNFTANLNHIQSDLFSTDLTQYILLAPNAPDTYDQYGQLNWANGTFSSNPMAFLQQTNNSRTDNLGGNLLLSYKLLKNLTIKTSIGYTKLTRVELQKMPLAAYPPGFGYTAADRTSYFTNNYNNAFIAEPQITYLKQIGKGKIDALVGLSLQANSSQLSTITASNFNSDDLLENIGSAGLLANNSTSFVESRYSSIFARINYSLADKYFFNLTARRDGSSRFGPGRQYGNFGAIGSSWLFSEEKLIKENFSFLSFGKLRASYGITGNDQIADYGYFQLYNSGATYQGNATLVPAVNAANADFGWETNRKLEGGIQLGFLNDKISLEVSYYRNRSSNELLFQSLPLSTGLNSVQRNLPGEVQNTGWEFEAGFKILNLKSFQWTSNINLTIPKNELLSYPGLATTSFATLYQVGQPLSILKTYNVTVDKQTGLYTTEDYNKNGVRDDGDRYIIKFVGQYYYGGLQNSFKFKQFTLDCLFAFTKQNAISYRTAATYAPGRWLQGIPNNQFADVLSRWQQPGDESSIQKFSTLSANNTLNNTIKQYGNISVVDASYIKLRNVSISYSLPNSMISKLRIKNAAITLQGQNLFTITNYVGLDPETQSANSVLTLPPLRTVMLGLNLTL